ncbi:sulfiredoxin [Pichia kluyveri]|uniref:Sulfiredoxin n=1 Tax=Pichia kluyveri TaxID=36015 RepID=A0AAV5R3F7_PICKL|nr:sulfiredoxin [Pichia kluyveri]
MSLQTRNYGKIEFVPLSDIIRPIMPVLDNEKIDTMVKTLEGVPTPSKTCQIENIVSGELPPIDVLCVSQNGVKKYFAFGGCHRFQAYDRAGVPMVKCKVLPSTKSQLKLYLGSSVDSFFD